MPFVDNNGVKIYYESHGSGPALFFGHGYTLDSRLWREQVEFFSKNYQVVTIDSRGHGKSDSPETGYSRDHRESDLVAVMDYLGIESAHLVGLSMGGITAVGFTIDYPERVKSLVLVSAGYTKPNPSGRLDPITLMAREQGLEAAKARWIETTLRYFDDKPGPAADLMRTMMNEHSGSAWLDPNRGQYPNRDDLALLADVSVKALILVGDRDLKFHKYARELHSVITGSKLEFIPEVGHIINLEAPELFNERLERWLSHFE